MFALRQTKVLTYQRYAFVRPYQLFDDLLSHNNWLHRMKTRCQRRLVSSHVQAHRQVGLPAKATYCLVAASRSRIAPVVDLPARPHTMQAKQPGFVQSRGSRSPAVTASCREHGIDVDERIVGTIPPVTQPFCPRSCWTVGSKCRLNALACVANGCRGELRKRVRECERSCRDSAIHHLCTWQHLRHFSVVVVAARDAWMAPTRKQTTHGSSSSRGGPIHSAGRHA